MTGENMNFLELQDEVQIVLQDNSNDIVSRIPGWINDSMEMVIDRVDMPGFKSLISVDTVVSQAYASLPSDCSGRILYASDGKNELEVVSLEWLLEDCPGMNEEGNIDFVAVEGSLIYYHKIPSVATTLTILHRRMPDLLVNDNDEPSGIPRHLQRGVLVTGAAMLGYDFIEDGLEGDKVNTAAQTILYRKGLYEILNWVAKRVPHRTRSVWTY